jgi:hypothetical protein
MADIATTIPNVPKSESKQTIKINSINKSENESEKIYKILPK